MHASWRQFGYADKAFIGHIKRVKLLPSGQFRAPLQETMLCAARKPISNSNSYQNPYCCPCPAVALCFRTVCIVGNQHEINFCPTTSFHCISKVSFFLFLPQTGNKLDKLSKNICHNPERMLVFLVAFPDCQRIFKRNRKEKQTSRIILSAYIHNEKLLQRLDRKNSLKCFAKH